MKRKDFLRITTSGSAFLLGGALLPDLSYDLKRVTVYDNYIKGVRHYLKRDDAIAFKQEHQVHLEREASNENDRFAVRIVYKGRKIGYVAAFENVVIANMMDHGVELEAEISEVNPAPNQYLSNAIGIRVSAQLMVPIHKLEENDLTAERADDVVDEYRRYKI